MIAALPFPAALAASPARLALAAGERETIRVTNSGGGVALVDVAPAGFALDLRGRPRIVRTVSPRLEVQPRRLTIAPGAASTVTVSATLPAGARPGDHPALVLLTTRPRPGAGLGARLQIGIVVIVRAPGAVTHRLAVRQLRVRHARTGDLLEVSVWNRGNVAERLGPDVSAWCSAVAAASSPACAQPRASSSQAPRRSRRSATAGGCTARRRRSSSSRGPGAACLSCAAATGSASENRYAGAGVAAKPAHTTSTTVCSAAATSASPSGS